MVDVLHYSFHKVQREVLFCLFTLPIYELKNDVESGDPQPMSQKEILQK
jgi:hypothetical protein